MFKLFSKKCAEKKPLPEGATGAVPGDLVGVDTWPPKDVAGVYLVTGILRVEDKAIFLLGSCKGAEDFETLSHSMCGLTHVVFRLLTTSHTPPPIEMGEVVDKTTNNAIAKRVVSWFTSGRESVQKWEASL